MRLGRHQEEGQLLQGAIKLNRLKARRGPKKAICAVAASIFTAIYHMLKDSVEHNDLGASHFDLQP